MSDELQILTTNAASDGWVDGVPGAVSTGYQAQNTALQALFNGVDKSSCSVSGANLVIAAGGLIDDSGLPFVITEAITLALPTTGAANWFLRVVPGSTALERSIEFTDDRGTHDAAKNGFYDSDGYRVLNFVINRFSKKISKLNGESKTSGEINDHQYPSSYLTCRDILPILLATQISYFADAGVDSHPAYRASTNQVLLLEVGSQTVYVYDDDGTTSSNFSLTLPANHSAVAICIDNITDTLLVLSQYTPGGYFTHLCTMDGVSGTFLSSFQIAIGPVQCDIDVDINTGNLIAMGNIYNGISSTVLSSYTNPIAGGVTGLTCIDPDGNSIIISGGTDPSTASYLIFLDMTTRKITGFANLPNEWGIAIRGSFDYINGRLYITNKTTGACYRLGK